LNLRDIAAPGGQSAERPDAIGAPPRPFCDNRPAGFRKPHRGCEMPADPLISVILPTFNRLEFLRAAVTSVFEQTFARWELVIADDGSAEETRVYLRELSDPRVRVLLRPASGNPAATRNAAIRAARGAYLAFLDSDDLWLPDKLETQVRLMQRQPERRWSYTRASRIDRAGRSLSEPRLQAWLPFDGDIVEPLLRLDALIATATVMADRALVVEAGAFDEKQMFAEDYDLWLRLALRSQVSVVDAPLTCLRVHGEHYSADRVAARESWIRLYAKMHETVDSRRLRTLCRRLKADNTLVLASLHRHRGAYGRAARAYLSALATGWRSPRFLADTARRVFRSSGRLDVRRQ
jgi:glycosyltransferase involved in cell wall biosynthesis